jgi:hypothetical protein
LGYLGKVGKDTGCSVDIGGFAADTWTDSLVAGIFAGGFKSSQGNGRRTAIDDSHILSFAIPLKPKLQPTQWIVVGVGAMLGGVEDDMRHGADGVGTGAGDSAGAEARCVVSEITRVGATIVRWKGKIG